MSEEASQKKRTTGGKVVASTTAYARAHNTSHHQTAKEHRIQYPEHGTTTVNIVKKNMGRTGADGMPKGEWFVRADNAHRGAEYPHININSHITGTPDPHFRIPHGAPEAARAGAKVLQKANKVIKVAGPVLDAASLGYSGYQDYVNSTTRNTVEKVSGIAGGYAGALGGFQVGLRAGALGGPVGAVAGGVVGGISGGIVGSLCSEAAVDAIGDMYDYNMDLRKCELCQNEFKARKYQGEKRCPKCRG